MPKANPFAPKSKSDKCAPVMPPKGAKVATNVKPAKKGFTPFVKKGK